MGEGKVYSVLQAVELPEDDHDVDDFEKLASEVAPTKPEAPAAIVGERATVAEDFIQSWFLNAGLTKSLEVFQKEWYEKKENGELASEDTEVVRDLHFKNQQMYEECKKIEQELAVAKDVAKKSLDSLDKFRKERDFHRMSYYKVIDEKEGLMKDLQKLKSHYENYEPTLGEMKHKYEIVMKEKMLLRIERDKILKKIDSLQPKDRKSTSQEKRKNLESKPSTTSTQRTGADDGPKIGRSGLTFAPKLSCWPEDDEPNPHLAASYEAVKPDALRVHREFKKSHEGGVSRVKFHPKSALISVGDDHAWRMWSLSSMGELIIAGTGHSDFVSGIDIHPKKENIVVTSCGDGKCKIWDISQEKCTHTISDHAQTAWNVAFHDSGDFFATCSEDGRARIYDFNALSSGRMETCRTVLRGHTDGINYVSFQAFSHVVVTASQDKTVSLWDMRNGECTSTLYGHTGSVNHATFALQGHLLATADLNGAVKLWDPRNLKEQLNVSVGAHAANACAFDRSGKTLAIACGDGTLKLIDTQEQQLAINLEAHEDQVLDVAFDPQGKFMATSCSDGSVKLWQEK